MKTRAELTTKILSKKPLFALDLGTTKFCLACLFIDQYGQPQLEVISVPAQGMRRGMLSDLPKAEAGLQELIERAEDQLQLDIDQVVVGIAGSHLASQLTSSSISLPTEVVSPNDVALLDRQVREQYQIKSRELLHAVGCGYRIDSREPIENPVGFSGRILNGDYLIIDADKSYLRDVVGLCNRCGLAVAQLFSEPFASASVTVADELKQAGVVVADIGGGTTDGIVFIDGLPRQCFTVNIGGVLMSKDIAVGINCEEQEAERIKHYILNLNEMAKSEARLDFRSATGETKSFSYEQLLQIIVPRIDELAQLLVEQLRSYRGQLKGGILLTGGGSRIEGLANYLSNRFMIPVQASEPKLSVPYSPTQSKNASGNDIDTLFTRRLSSQYATVLGLLNLEFGRLLHEKDQDRGTWPKRYLSQFINWLRELS